jgi:RHS repeat-associated protein
MAKFTGKERDSETGLDYFGARYYGNSMGRWISPDPLMASAHSSDPQSWNRYVYTFNNPLRYIDPDGMEVPESCSTDPKCKITVKLNVIYDKSVKWSDKAKQKLEAAYLEKAKKDYKNSNIELKVSYSAGTVTRDDSGYYHMTGLQKDSLNVYFSNGTGTNRAGAAFNTPYGDVAIVDPGHLEALSTNTLWPLGTNTLEHEMAHHFLGHTSEKQQGSHEMETDWKVYKQGVWDRPVEDFRQGLEHKTYAAPTNPEANKPKQ